MKKLIASEVLCKTRRKQTENVLACSDGKMCAEGVLLAKMGYKLKDLVNVHGVTPRSVEYSPRVSRLDKFFEQVRKVYGMDRMTWRQIAMKNDEGWSFKEIANWLKEQGL